MEVSLFHWVVFNAIVVFLLVTELIRFARSPHRIEVNEALIKSAGWIGFALLINLWIYIEFGSAPALDFLTGYLVEKSLSIDNLFVFLILFKSFKTPEELKHKALFFGVLGAIVMRAVLIWIGLSLVAQFSWIFVVFGLFLIFTGIRIFFPHGEKPNWLEPLLKKWLPYTSEYHGSSFFWKKKATPLFLLLICIEFTDLVFALDSIPAIIGITTEPFIVYTSNICAVLGLRALFFALEGMLYRFALLHYALGFILVFIGAKMLLIEWVHVPTWATFVVVALSLTVAMLLPNKKHIE